uniref:Transcription repressor n=1 Tax=Solanum lycopersicum TaxID=4081 RepID=A0A3Q7ILN2_SOLLC
MKFSSLFKSNKKPSFSPMLCRLPRCGDLRTLSIRDENNHNIFNSQRFYNNVDDEMVDEVIESLKLEKDRFFVEAGQKTSLILDMSSSRLSKKRTISKRLEFLPFNNDSCVITSMDSIDAYGETSRSILEGSSSRLSKSTNNSTSSKRLGYLPSNDSMDSYGDQETSSILDMSSSSSNDNISSKGLGYLPSNESMDATSILERSKSNSSHGFVYYVPCKKTYAIMRLISRDPYEDIKYFLEKMVDENLEIEDWEESLEELCGWLLEINEKNIHKYIVGAFCDLWMSYSCTSTINTPFGFSSSKPPSLYFMSLIENEADRMIAASTSSVTP